MGPEPRDGDWRQLWTSSAAHLFYIFPFTVGFDEVDLILFPWWPLVMQHVSSCTRQKCYPVFHLQAFIFPF